MDLRPALGAATRIGLLTAGALAACSAWAEPAPEEIRPPGWALPAYDDTHPADLVGLLEPIRAEFGLPALAGAIVTRDRLVAVGAVGTRKAGSDTPVRPGDRFHLGSCTKSMTATLLGLLVEAGKAGWGDTLAELFPEQMAKADPGWRDVTLEQILAHRGGFSGSFPQGMNPGKLPGSAREQRAAYLRALLAQPPAYPPGSKHEYANAGYALAGCLIEKLTDSPWETAIAERLFRPLGMASAGFGAAGTPGQVDQPWQHRWRDGAWSPVEPGPRADNHDVIGPAGKVHASLPDWARYVALHLRGAAGQDGLLKAETVRRLQGPPREGSYFAGWVAAERSWGGGRVLWHNGSNTMNYCIVWMAPQRGFAVMAATNAGGGEAPAKATDRACSAMIGFYRSLPQGGVGDGTLDHLVALPDDCPTN